MDPGGWGTNGSIGPSSIFGQFLGAEASRGPLADWVHCGSGFGRRVDRRERRRWAVTPTGRMRYGRRTGVRREGGRPGYP
ncbi:hypothetical protein [Halalkalicoccus salilacus]|uniref:hypothetical protein n=1 Tax=Halalkalicoccus sp. GCM10025704 TaxID=3252662 RepID=UPI003619736F